MRSISILTLVVALALMAAAGAESQTTDPCIAAGETPVLMKAPDGATVYGVEVGTGSTGVVLAHQYFSTHCEFMGFARELAAAGFRALAIDFRYNGASTGGNSARLDLDVVAAAARLRADGAKRVELVGASMGGTAVLVAAAEISPPVDGVVSLSGPTYFRGLNAVKAVRRSHVPVRFVVTRGERRFAPDATYLMRAAAARDKAILRVANGGHGSSLLTMPSARAFVVAFLSRQSPGPPPTTVTLKLAVAIAGMRLP
jgi:dienelactone hydrolase